MLFAIIVTAQASVIGLHPLVAPGSIIKGASAAGAAVGLDGAVLTAVDGATIVGVTPVRPAIASAVVAPRVIGVGHGLLAAPSVVAAAPATSAVVAGPSGAIAASTGAALGVAPVVTRTVVAAPAVASASAIVAPAVARVAHVGHLGHVGLGHGLIL